MTTLAKPDTTNNHLANERTFLAWIRTSISVIVFGFVVARFGIALREFMLIQHHVTKESNDSMYIGVGFMTVGIIIALLSMTRYRINMIRIESGQFKPANRAAILLGLFSALFGAILVVYLIFTAQTL